MRYLTLNDSTDQPNGLLKFDEERVEVFYWDRLTKDWKPEQTWLDAFLGLADPDDHVKVVTEQEADQVKLLLA